MSAEAQRVAQGVPDVRRTALVGHHIQITRRVRGLIVDGGGEEAVPQAQGGEDGLHGSGGPQHVARHGLGGAHGQLIGVRAEHGFHRGGLPGVVEVGGGAVGVDVAHLLRRNAAVGQRHGYGLGAAAAVRKGGGDVMGVAGSAVARHLGVDLGSPGLGVLQFL